MIVENGNIPLINPVGVKWRWFLEVPRKMTDIIPTFGAMVKNHGYLASRFDKEQKSWPS